MTGSYRLGEMFCGPGGLALGARKASTAHEGTARIRHGWALDYHADTLATYRKNFGEGGPFATGFGPVDDGSVFHADVREFDLRQAPPHDAFAFGFPCNDFSTVGEHRGLEGAYGALYTYGIHSLALHAPEWFIAENVSGLSRANEGRALGKILDAMREPASAALTDPTFISSYTDVLPQVDPSLRYEVTAHLYRFEEYEVPQKRHRILIVGIRQDIRDQLPAPFAVPRPTTTDPYDQRTVANALDDKPIPHGTANNVRIRHKGLVEERLSRIEPGKSAFNTDWSEFPHLALNVKGVTLSNIYRRLKGDEPAYTVTGSGGGGTHMYHHRDYRALTNRERARLQTFPDEFEFIGSQPSVRRQVGMAVPPHGAAVVFEAILKTLDGISYDSETANIRTDELIEGYRQGQLELESALEGEALAEAAEQAEARSRRTRSASSGDRDGTRR